jgi:ubiquitin carboxyl-terminal hydrolase 7
MSYRIHPRRVVISYAVLDGIPDLYEQSDPPTGSIMIFLKHFDNSKQTLYGVGKVYVLRNSKVGDLMPLINERMRWGPGTPLKLYEVCVDGLRRTLTDNA